MVKWVIAATAIIAGIAVINVYRIDSAVSAAGKYQDEISVHAYYRMGIVPDSIVFDLWEVGLGASQAEVLGVLLRFADELKNREFREVRLAYRGETKFILDGDDFGDIGREFSSQNAVYTIRTLPEKLRTPHGERAFSRWSGGLLGVVGRQMEDVNEFGKRWYLDDIFRAKIAD